MKFPMQVKKTLSDVSTASERVVESTEWATVALVAVSVVAVLALAVATTALVGSRAHA